MNPTYVLFDPLKLSNDQQFMQKEGKTYHINDGSRKISSYLPQNLIIYVLGHCFPGACYLSGGGRQISSTEIVEHLDWIGLDPTRFNSYKVWGCNSGKSSGDAMSFAANLFFEVIMFRRKLCVDYYPPIKEKNLRREIKALRQNNFRARSNSLESTLNVRGYTTIVNNWYGDNGNAQTAAN